MTNEEIQNLLEQAAADLNTINADLVAAQAALDQTKTLLADVAAWTADAAAALLAARAALEPTPPPPPPPPPLATSGLFEYAVCLGANSRGWTTAQHTWAFDQLKALKDARPGNKPFAVRVEGFANNALVNRDVDASLARGLTPFLCWDGSAGVHTLDVAGLTAFAKKYPGCVYSYCNEPDLNRGAKVAWPPDQYAAACKQFYDVVKAADPTAIVLWGELWKGQLPAGVTSWDQKDPAKYLRPFITEFIKAGMPADGICHHSYDDPVQIAQWWNMWGWWYEGGIYGTGTGRTFSEILKAAGWTKPILDTESGSKVNSGQAGKITRLLNMTKTGPSDGTTIYSFYDNNDGFPIADKATLTVNAGYTAFLDFMGKLPA